MIGKNGVSLLIGHNGVQDKTTLNAANETVARGIYDATTLSAVDAELATANIKNGITIFGFAGDADVHDISDATAIEAEVLSPETFYAVSGGIRTGTMPTVALDPAFNEYPAGYHAGEASLTAVDAELATGNIKSGITIFGVAGHANVHDISDADLTEAEAPTGKTFYAVSGGIRTGTGTKTLSPDNETVNAGYYTATTLSAVDIHLAAGNIALGVTIFGFVGTVAPGGVETIEKYADAVIADGATYTPAASGIFFSMSANQFNVEYYSTVATAWYAPSTVTSRKGATAIGDGTNFRIKNTSGDNAEYCLMRHYISTGTYERAMDQDLALGTQWTPATSGFFATGGENNEIYMKIQRTIAGWTWTREGSDGGASNEPMTIVIGDGTNLQVANTSGAAARYHVTMRAKMT